MKTKKEKKIKIKIKTFIFGMIIGLGYIIPGVSGGVLAVMLGIYDKVIYSINNFKKDILKHCSFLFTLFLGIIISVLLFSKIINYLLEYKEFAIKYVFIGFILGCFPNLLKKGKEKYPYKLSYVLITFTILMSLMLFLISKNIFYKFENITFISLVISGMLYAFGKIVPGVSGTILLMMIGTYKYLLEILSNPFGISKDIIIQLIPFFISLLISSVVLFKLINLLLKKHYSKMYSVIIGFSFSSILYIFPGFEFNSRGIIYILLLSISFLISYLLMKDNTSSLSLK